MEFLKPVVFPLRILCTLYMMDVLTRIYTSYPGTNNTLSKTKILASAGETF